jgi:hypothetical protein
MFDFDPFIHSFIHLHSQNNSVFREDDDKVLQYSNKATSTLLPSLVPCVNSILTTYSIGLDKPHTYRYN